MNIIIKLSVTPSQLTAIAKLLDQPEPVIADTTPEPAIEQPVITDTTPEPPTVTEKVEDTTPKPKSNPFTSPATDAILDEVDARGIPWNAEVHASSKAKTSTGNWRAKRGVDKQRLAEVEQGAIAPPSIEEQAAAPVAPPAAPKPPQKLTFIELLPKIVEAQAAGNVSQENIDFVCQKFGVSGLGQFALPNQAENIPKLAELLGVE